MNTQSHIAALLLSGFLAACSTLPETIPEVEQARMDVKAADRHPMVERVAGSELTKAKAALDKADAEIRDNGDLQVVKHHAYVASRHAEIAMERIREQEALAQIEDSEAERTKALLQAREAEVELESARATEQARIAEEKERLAEARELQARLAQERAERATAEADELRSLVEDLEAERTDRGLVLTLGDVLFDVDRTELKPGAMSTIDRLADFLVENDSYALVIEGHTDSTGEAEYNEALSSRRADAVRSALLSRGIDGSRLRVLGRGESYPVASNDSSAGRQQNRRVEIIVSNADGEFPFDDAKMSANQ